MTGKVVIDTSCLVRAALRPDSVPDQAVTLALSGFQLCASSEALHELEVVLQRQRFNSYVSITSRNAFIASIRSHAQIFTLTDSARSDLKECCRDENDEFILALALAAEADVIVSSDHDLLALHPWRGIPIVTPAQFVAQFSR